MAEAQPKAETHAKMTSAAKAKAAAQLSCPNCQGAMVFRQVVGPTEAR